MEDTTGKRRGGKQKEDKQQQRKRRKREDEDDSEEKEKQDRELDDNKEEKKKPTQLPEELAIRQYDAYLATIRKNYTPLHAELYSIEGWKLAPSLQEALEKGAPEDLFAVLMEAGRVEGDEGNQGQGVFIFECLDLDFCNLLTEEIDHFERWCHSSGLHVKRPNSMNNYGAILDHFGFEKVLQDLIHKCIEPFSRLLFPHIHSTPAGDKEGTCASLDSHHAFAVEYGQSKDTKLDIHVDDSEVTLNICLGKTFTGGELEFTGVRCEAHRASTPPLRSHGEGFRLGQKPGWGILHLGQHRHAARQILSGHRTNLIIWCHSTEYRKQAGLLQRLKICPEWCGWHAMQ